MILFKKVHQEFIFKQSNLRQFNHFIFSGRQSISFNQDLKPGIFRRQSVSSDVASSCAIIRFSWKFYPEDWQSQNPQIPERNQECKWRNNGGHGSSYPPPWQAGW